jgi:SAM-dependent methyltransferase
MHHCRICGGPGGEYFDVREMLYGTRERFAYFACSLCHCLQIAEVPADLSIYYPRNYYSFSKPKESSRVKRAIRRRRLEAFLGKGGYFWRWINGRSRHQPSWLWWARKARIDPVSRILDVGCGAGQLLVNMSNWGFRRLTGVEPHIEADIAYPAGVQVLKRSIEDTGGVFDFIMFHHSFEHIAEPLSALRSTCRMLAPGGRALIRIPVADGEAWRIYGVDWVQLDAPRHLYLHTATSIRILADHAGLELDEVVFDSNGFQFWGSELYRRDIPLHEDGTGRALRPERVFSEEELLNFEARARELNDQGRGDQACFFLRKPEMKAKP